MCPLESMLLGTFHLKLCLKNLRLETFAVIFRLELSQGGPLVRKLSLGAFAGSLRIFHLGSLARELSLGNFRLESVARHCSLRICRLNLSLENVLLRFSAGHFRLKSFAGWVSLGTFPMGLCARGVSL